MADLKNHLQKAVTADSPEPLVELAKEELEKLKLAEEILEARFQAKKRSNRIATMSTMLVGWVALAGFFANAYQNYNNKQHLREQSEREQAKWQQEFERARAADKHRAFFETSSLVTDPANADRRLIGYALLEEFVADPDYHGKAVAILEESLSRELAEVNSGNEVQQTIHQNAMRQIVKALSASSDCDELAMGSRSIDRLLRYAKTDDTDESRKVLGLYVRRLVGRGAQVCKSFGGFLAVREPIAVATGKASWLVGAPGEPSRPEMNRILAQLLLDECKDEENETASSECVAIRKGYAALCEEAEQDSKRWADESPACGLVRAAAGAAMARGR